MSDEKLPMDDERYRIPGTNTFNLSAWSRENEPKAPPQFKLGDIVVFTTTAEITRVYQDVDGTPLYSLDIQPHGHNEESIRPATEEEKDNF